ncbi:hypothetical protein [Flagellimonas flava]|nr:hypothetical protein [Allomuricauda flava]
MLQQLHLAAQYLAAAGISFLDKKEDDSHTNLGFSITQNRLETWPLDTYDTKLCLNYEAFALEWSGKEVPSFPLHDKSHAQVLDWIASTAKEVGLTKSYHFHLHYDLPYSHDADTCYSLSGADAIGKLIQLRVLAQNSIDAFLRQEELSSEIRIWPHHFDTGAFSSLNDGSGKSVGLGMAIPDTVVNDLYFYISGYRGHNALNTWAFKSLTHGKWINDGFKGAVLPASGMNEKIVVQFFSEALNAYKS